MGSMGGGGASASTGGTGFGLGQPLVSGDIGNASYANGPASSGIDWSGVASSAAKGYLAGAATPEQKLAMAEASSSGDNGYGGQFSNPGASSFSGLLLSDQNRASA